MSPTSGVWRLDCGHREQKRQLPRQDRRKQDLKVCQGGFSCNHPICHPLSFVQGSLSRLCTSRMKTVKWIPANARPVN